MIFQVTPISQCFRSHMANQILAAQMIPRLGVTGLASPPPGRLPSHLDLLRLLLHQQHYNLRGFQGMGRSCCKVDGKTHKARCTESNDLMVPWDECRTGCIEARNPCLLAKIKQNWEIAHLPIKDRDEHILRAMGKVKEEYDKMSKHLSEGTLTAENTQSLKRQTVNLAPMDWESRIKADRLTSASQHTAKIDLMNDYFSEEGTRFVSSNTTVKHFLITFPQICCCALRERFGARVASMSGQQNRFGVWRKPWRRWSS